MSRITVGSTVSFITRNTEQARAALAAGNEVLRVTWQAILAHHRPALFEHPTPSNPLPWPLEPHNRGLIPEDWWQPHSLAADDEQGQVALSRWAEDLLDCEAHPGMIVRNVHVAFRPPDLRSACAAMNATRTARGLPPMLDRS